MAKQAAVTKIDRTLVTRVDPEGKLNLASCLQCGRCSSGCTMRTETDILPHQMNRMALLGMTDRLLASKAIWICASCHACVSRCPMKVDTPALVDKLREMASDAPEETKRIRVFNETMLGSMRMLGRVYEFGMMGVYKMRTRDFLSDLGKFPTMLRKGKMKLAPPSVKGRGAVASIFDRTRRARGRNTLTAAPRALSCSPRGDEDASHSRGAGR